MPGAGTSSSTQNTTQQSQTGPWQPAQGILQGILAQAGGMNLSPTGGQENALNNLTSATSNLTDYAPEAGTDAAAALGYNTTPQQGTLTSANNSIAGTLSPYLSSSYLNPMTTPGLSTSLQGLNNSITNNINDEFAAAGMTGSPANATALAYGLAQGEAPLITQQYNTNVGQQQAAAQDVFNNANTTASGLTAQQLAALQGQTTGANLANEIPTLATTPGAAQYSVASLANQTPYSDIGLLSSLVSPIAALGSQSSGTSSTTGTSTASPLQDFDMLSSGLGGSSYNPMTGAYSGTGLTGFLWSDENLKEDITPVGMLYDSTPIYSYRYKPELDPSGTPRIGVMAQDVEKTTPEAVVEIGPERIKAVDYGKATERSRMIGMLHDLDMAA